MVKKQRISSIYFSILGICTLIFGFLDIIVAIGGQNVSIGALEIPADMFRGGWGGFIVLSSGLFYLSGCRNISEIHQFSKIVMGSVLLWIVAGCDIFGMICESIPGGEEGPWFNTLGDFLGTYAPPYPPAIFLLPFSLVVIFCPFRKVSRKDTIK